MEKLPSNSSNRRLDSSSFAVGVARLGLESATGFVCWVRRRSSVPGFVCLLVGARQRLGSSALIGAWVRQLVVARLLARRRLSAAGSSVTQLKLKF
nr:hypothetical protein CFP56_15391 [Quercus suber]